MHVGNGYSGPRRGISFFRILTGLHLVFLLGGGFFVSPVGAQEAAPALQAAPVNPEYIDWLFE